MKKSESGLTVVKSIATIAFVGGALAALVIWARVRSHRLIDRVDDALSELEHRSPDYDLKSLEHFA